MLYVLKTWRKSNISEINMQFQITYSNSVERGKIT
jgi:hypothetical protein